MDPKPSQRRVVDEIETHLRALAAEQAAGNRKHAAKDAWQSLRRSALARSWPNGGYQILAILGMCAVTRRAGGLSPSTREQMANDAPTQRGQVRQSLRLDGRDP